MTSRSRLGALVELARIDQWVKNVAILPGAIVAAMFRPHLTGTDALRVGLVFVAACLLSSSSYVLNGILDQESDRRHPVKLDRPLPAGRIAGSAAWLEWALLGVTGLGLAWLVSASAGWTSALFAATALLYNVPPLRAKDVPYIDIVVEAFNNPLRLALGWFAVEASLFPPLSLLIAYWSLGAFILAIKRLAELRFLSSRSVPVALYRRSFAHYSQERLLAVSAFHLVVAACLAGVFIVRFKLELILILPAGALFVAYYLWVGLREESEAQSPERVFRRPLLIGYLAACLLLFLVLVRSDLPALYSLFNVKHASAGELWKVE